MDVLSLCRLPVGIVRWHSPAPSLTVIVKATFTLERDGYAALAPEQQPLSLDRPGVQTGPNELFVATDFVPFKPRADVLLAGHAHAPAPAWAIRARLRVNAFDKPFFALAGKPATFIPLADAYLRSRPSLEAGFVRVGARAPWSPERAVFVGTRLISPSGLPVAPLPHGFDFRIFQAAPQDQQLDTPLTTAFVVLEGLLPGAPVRQVQLPGLYPRVFLLSRALDPRATPPAQAPLRADTLWIDTDRAQCTLTFRAVVPLAQEPPELCVVLERVGAVQNWPAVYDLLGRAARIRAIEAPDLAHPAPACGWSIQRTPSEPAVGPRGIGVPPAPAARRSELGLSATKSPKVASIDDEPEWATGTVGLKPGQPFAPAVPFKQNRRTDRGAIEARPPRGPHGTEFPPAPDEADVPEAPEWAQSTLDLKPGRVFVPAVPFRPASPPPAAGPVSPLPPAEVALEPEHGRPKGLADAPDADAEPATERRELLIQRFQAAPMTDVEEEPDWAAGTAALKPGQVFAPAVPFISAAMQGIPPAQEAHYAAPSVRRLLETETLDAALVVAGATHAPKAVLPFQRGPMPSERTKAESPHSESVPQASRSLMRTEPPPAATPLSQALPWVSRSPMPHEPPSAWSARPVTPLLAAEPRPSPPPAAPQIEELPLLPAERFAAIKAAIWTASTARHGVLEQHDLTEIDWEIAEQRQMEALQREASEGRVERLLALLVELDRVRGGQGLPPLLHNALAADCDV